MSNPKHAPKRKRGAKAVPVLGAAGLLSLAGGASARPARRRWQTCLLKRLRQITESCSARKSFPTSACRPSMFSTRRAPSLSLVTRSLGVDAAVVDAAAAAVAAADVAGAAAAAVAAAAVGAAGSGAVAASAKADHVQIQWTKASVRGRLDFTSSRPFRFIFAFCLCSRFRRICGEWMRGATLCTRMSA